MYVDDTAMPTQSQQPNRLHDKLKRHIDNLGELYINWKITVIPEKSEAMQLQGWKRRRTPDTNITMKGEDIHWRTKVKYLGERLDDKILQETRPLDQEHSVNGPQSTNLEEIH